MPRHRQSDRSFPEKASVLSNQEFERARIVLAGLRGPVAGLFAEAGTGTLRQADEATAVVEEIIDSMARHPMALIGLAGPKSGDDRILMHLLSTSALMVALAGTLGFDDRRKRHAGLVGLLHDIGKAQIPLEILNKPGALDETQWKTMRSHATRSYLILKDTPGLPADLLDGVRHHHEKIDGTGYPDRLKGDQISPLAKMCALCDVYDALISDLPYKPGWHPAIALRRMGEITKGHLDPVLFRAFVKTLGIYPVGSLVRLSSQRLAVVVNHDPKRLLQPTVKVFFCLRSKLQLAPVLLDLGEARCREQIVGAEDPKALGLAHVDQVQAPPTLTTA